MSSCYFCDELQKRKSVLWENDCWFSIFDTYPVSPGHSLIIPKRHLKDFNELKEIEWRTLLQAIQKTIVIVEKTNLRALYEQFVIDHETDISVWFCKKALEHPKLGTKPEGYNHGFNDGKAAGRTVDHLHWHSIPRFMGDMENSQGGVRYVIPNMGEYTARNLK